MNAITLYQPWASLCVLPGEDGRAIKPYETRSWMRKSLLGQRTAIHAGMKWDGSAAAKMPRKVIDEALKRVGLIWGGEPHEQVAEPWPLSVIVGSAVVKAFWRASGGAYIHQPGETRGIKSQLPFGDFSEGRWAWELTDVERLVAPMPAKGKQGIWKLTDEQEEAYLKAEKVRL